MTPSAGSVTSTTSSSAASSPVRPGRQVRSSSGRRAAVRLRLRLPRAAQRGVAARSQRVPGTDVVARADEWFAARGRGYSMNVRDGFAEDDDLRAAATEAAGLVSMLNAPEMVRRTPVDDRALLPGCELRWVEDRSTFDDFVNISDLAYSTVGMPVGHDLGGGHPAGGPAGAARALGGGLPRRRTRGGRPDGPEPRHRRRVLGRHRRGGEGQGARRCGDPGGHQPRLRRRGSSQHAPGVVDGRTHLPRMGYETIYRYSTLVRFEPTTI